MAIQIREVLNADQMALPIYCGGLSRLGIQLLGTWTGTVSFQASTDGIVFRPVSMRPFASGTTVQAATANGNWEMDVLNNVAFRAVFSRATGSVTVVLAVSTDASYQDAFLIPSSQFLNSVATAALNTLTVAASTNRGWRLRTLVVTVLGGTVTWAAQPVVQIKDGATLLHAYDLPTTNGAMNVIPLPADSNTPGVSGGASITRPATALSLPVPPAAPPCRRI